MKIHYKKRYDYAVYEQNVDPDEFLPMIMNDHLEEKIQILTEVLAVVLSHNPQIVRELCEKYTSYSTEFNLVEE